MSLIKDITQRLKEEKTEGLLKISFFASVVGIVSGFGAILFRYLIAFFHNLFFFGSFSLLYDSNAHFISRWDNWVFIVPAVGAAIVGYLVVKFAPEAKGHGVPEVMEAVIEKGGRIRPVVAVIKSLASSICIGSGGSVGREGPIVQIGSCFGSTLGQLLKLKPRDIITLVGCGAAGGIAATFNAPISGILFVIELILPEFSTKTFVPLVISSTIATYISRIFLGNTPAFVIPNYQLISAWEFIFYVILGLISGFIAILFIKMLHKFEDAFDNLKISRYVKPVIGGAVIGLMGFVFFKTFGHYYIFGVGYSFISDILKGGNLFLPVVITLIFAKMLATSLTLGSGGSGGVFAPSLFIGAATGGTFGIFIHHVFPSITAPASAYALVGMAAVVAGTTNATITAIVMSFEMTRAYSIILPLMLSAVLSDFVVNRLNKETIYTEKLIRRGIKVPRGKEINLLRTLHVKDIVIKDVVYVRRKDPVSTVLEVSAREGLKTLPVVDDEGRPIGIIRVRELFSLDKDQPIQNMIVKKDLFISPEITLLDALNKMNKEKTSLLFVMDERKIEGIITRSLILERYFSRKDNIL